MIRKFIERWMMPFTATTVDVRIRNIEIVQNTPGVTRQGAKIEIPDMGSVDIIARGVNKSGGASMLRLHVEDGEEQNGIPLSAVYVGRSRLTIHPGRRRDLTFKGYGGITVENNGANKHR